MEPGAGGMLFKQLLASKMSAVVLYRSAMEYSVSFMPTVMGIHPVGMLQVVGCTMIVGLGRRIGVLVGIAGRSVRDGSGDANSTAKVVGMGDGVGGISGAVDSASDNEMPPMTSRREMAPMIKPLPICRRAFIISSPRLSYPWRLVEAH